MRGLLGDGVSAQIDPVLSRPAADDKRLAQMLIRPSFSTRTTALACVMLHRRTPGSHDRRVQITQI
jgi:hypothetical protein